MKIGKFAQTCGVSVATIRYYISIGMLVPNDSSTQYEFSDREVEDLRLILRMKKQNFKLKEIQDYLVLTRHSRMIEPSIIDAAMQILEEKQKEISAEIEILKESYQEITEEIKQLGASQGSRRRELSGVPLSAVSLFCCPYCGRSLRVEDAVIQNGYLMSGVLSCPEGGDEAAEYQISIDNGIIKTGNLYQGAYDHPDLERGLYRDMSPDFDRGLRHSYDRISKLLLEEDLHGKVILEANINGYFYMYNHLNLLPSDCTLIVIDKYPEMLEMYKELIEQCNPQCQILYIADAGTSYPLREGCVDLYISYLGENEYLLYHEHTYLEDAGRFLKKNAKIYGAFISYDKRAESRKKLRKKYPESSPRLYQMDYLREEYQKNGYLLEPKEMSVVSDSGTKEYAFECHLKGENLWVYSFIARPTKDAR